jgi:ankyrin repeat protein
MGIAICGGFITWMSNSTTSCRDTQNALNEPLLPERETKSLYSFEAKELSAAVVKGDFESVQSIILKRTTICINQWDSEGKTSLYQAVAHEHLQIASLLIDMGASTNIENIDGYTPLHACAKNGNGQICDLLIRKDANVNAITKSHITPLHVAILENKIEILRILLNCDGILVNVRQDGSKETPFLEACALGHTKMAQLLLQKGAMPDSVDERGFNGLHLAAMNGWLDTTLFLISKGFPVSAKSKLAQMTPLHLACIHGHLEIVKILIDCKSDLGSIDDQRKTPLHHASQRGHADIASYLIDIGADVSPMDIDDQTPVDLAGTSLNYHKISKIFRDKKKKDFPIQLLNLDSPNTSHSAPKKGMSRFHELE